MTGLGYLLIKYLVSAALIVAISEAAERYPLLGALLASLPVVSLLAMVWLYIETRDAQAVAKLSSGVFWLVLPSLVLFALLPVLLRHGLALPWALCASIAATVGAYLAMLRVLAWAGVQL
jgi:hypothetical protein